MVTDCKGCGAGVTVGPAPYYEQVSQEVLQDHSNYMVDTRFVAGVYLTQSWNVPVIGEEIILDVPNLVDVPVGEYFHNPVYGYFRITQWDSCTGKIGIMNDNIKGTASPGSFVAENSLFIVTNKPCCDDKVTTIFPYVKENFEAPDVSLTKTIKVTSVFGLRQGDLIRIGTALYRLQTINSSDEIVILNEGGGYPVDTIVTALDGNEDYQYLLISENASTCAISNSEQGSLVVCDSNDRRILEGDYVGQVPVLTNITGNLVAFKFLDADIRVCNQLLSNVDLTIGIDVYNFPLADTSEFTVGNTIQVDFGEDRFTITAVNYESLDVEITETPIANSTYLAGVYVCKVVTAELLLESNQEVIDNVAGQIQDLLDSINATPFPVPVGASLDFRGTVAPSGFFLENGDAVDRITYATLFAVIGTLYGTGDGSTTFNLPDSRGRFSLAKNATGIGTGGVVGAAGGSLDSTHNHTVKPHYHTKGAGDTLAVNYSGSIETGFESVTHSHGFSTGPQSANHTHSGGTTSNGAHSHTYSRPITNESVGSGGNTGWRTPIQGATTSTDGDHSHTFTTGEVSANHTHSGTTEPASANHKHIVPDHTHTLTGSIGLVTGGVDGNTSQTTLDNSPSNPAYLVCTKIIKY